MARVSRSDDPRARVALLVTRDGFTKLVKVRDSRHQDIIRMPVYQDTELGIWNEGEVVNPRIPLDQDQSYREYERRRFNMQYGCIEYRERDVMGMMSEVVLKQEKVIARLRNRMINACHELDEEDS